MRYLASKEGLVPCKAATEDGWNWEERLVREITKSNSSPSVETTWECEIVVWLPDFSRIAYSSGFLSSSSFSIESFCDCVFFYFTWKQGISKRKAVWKKDGHSSRKQDGIKGKELFWKLARKSNASSLDDTAFRLLGRILLPCLIRVLSLGLSIPSILVIISLVLDTPHNLDTRLKWGILKRGILPLRLSLRAACFPDSSSFPTKATLVHSTRASPNLSLLPSFFPADQWEDIIGSLS